MIRNSIARAVSSLVTRPVNGAKLSFEIVMKKLFANGEQGFWYNPNDMGTMFQDSAGTTAINASGQPLGLVLDKGKGLALSSELKQSALARAVGTAPVATYDPATGVGTVNRVDASNQSFIVFNNTVGGKWYKVSVTSGSGSILLRAATDYGVTTIFATIAPSTTFNGYIYVALNTMLSIAAPLGSYSFTVNSIKEINGNHAYQTTSASRPILQDAPRRIDFDTVDDKLITNLPAQLTGCTVIRAVPGVGAQILTGQTIPAAYEDNTDHCGLIVINRALTPSETSAIAAEFNKRAGV